ncbi:lysine-rich nucleolar protein 1 isoform X2 [Melanotaenia boesemani]|uniref:lysine-rich nucleolar protein 1 isoform X2 n=1 Tax=Melanotaenia boesemani TaxID=1250792 RepID=UPI001C051E4C|nr:lysine-rich nucleolar protein 1 isoform X2 [Melanotaenia boesemani]
MTDSDEDVIFISEKPATELNEMTIDQAKRLVLQREIDQESQPKQPDKPLKTQRFAALKRPMETKMEEENSEDIVIKKEKKHKKVKLSQPENQSCTADVKTEKKSKKVDRVGTEEARCGEMKDKKKKRKTERDSLNDTNSFVEDGEDKRVNKKKKQLLNDKVKSVQSTQENIKKEEREEQKIGNKVPKKPKKNNATVSIEQTEENVKEKKKKETLLTKDRETKTKKKARNEIKLETPVTGVEEVKMKKKKKKVKPEGENGLEVKSKKKIQMDEDDKKTMEHVKEKKRKKKEHLTGEEVTETKPEKKSKEVEFGIKLETTEIEEVKSKKTAKKEKKSKAGNGLEVIETTDKKKREVEDGKTLKKKKNVLTKSETVTEEEETKVKKKKKIKYTSASAESVEEEETVPKKKIKVEAELPVMQGEVVDVQSGGSEVTQSKKSKKKKNSVKVERDAGADAGVKKKKSVKKELEDLQESPQVDVVFLSVKSGNADEVTINQERRLALQMEIDKASRPDNPPKPTGLGQWSTAQFDNSEQQQKFLRLMGGLKKGLQPTTASAGGANMAMGKKAQQQLQQGLLGEFERAHSRRMDFSSRGAGLGFTAPSNKKFSIDVNACRSVRFDD